MGGGKLAIDFPPSFPDDATAKGHQISWREMIEEHPWVTEDVFRRSVTLVRMSHQGPFIPGPALWLDYAQPAADELQREARARQRKLPRPPRRRTTSGGARTSGGGGEAQGPASLPERWGSGTARMGATPRSGPDEGHGAGGHRGVLTGDGVGDLRSSCC